MPSDLQFVARVSRRALAGALALLGLGSCSLLFSAPDTDARGDAGSTDADPLSPDADPRSPDATLGPCNDPNTLRIFHLDGDFVDACNGTTDLTPSESCAAGCFQPTMTGMGLQFVTSSPFRCFALPHSPDFEKDTLEISMRVRATPAENRVAIFSKDASGDASGHLGLYQVRHENNPALRYFVVKFQDASNEDLVCSQPVLHGLAEYAVVVTVGPEGASITVDDAMGSDDDIVIYGDNGEARSCTPSTQRQVKPTLKDNPQNLVLGVSNEQWGDPFVDRPYLGGLIDEIVIRGWDD